MMRIGITGQEGFIGRHLYNTLGLYPKEFHRVEYHRDFFDNDEKLNKFVSECDVVVHLAALNRHNDAQLIYDTNKRLVEKLIYSLMFTGSKAHVLFSSSSQEEHDNLYGRSKKEGRQLLSNWAENNGGRFTGMIIPNVFGPFCKPNYNSFIATFCHKLTHNELPNIEVDSDVKLIYIDDLVSFILKKIRDRNGAEIVTVPYTEKRKVSEVLLLLEDYKMQYFQFGNIPALSTPFEINLFNTFRSYIDHDRYFPVKFACHADQRGKFVEIVRLKSGGQISFSTTFPGVIRGNHFHTRKIERFSVIKGKALIQLRQIGTNEILDFFLSGEEPGYVDMPIWYTHNIKNIGTDELYTLFWINECFDPANPDTYMEHV
ncbi:NAD-dependent epimerase/dehydratase family protein [Arcticibacter tournemirensis]|uniref:SDR family oxidoreductase n=1 Tax=Arcticibacter tournemirensis TaxID=699437 RepID=A0A4Q0M7P1_9SPHI|nr:NAD-dependent epimerase/dehydratase family protein [Arcticibacter tournemirensis]RXF69128.1 SDR family oxidoreductase [Arcticibacter tournemirensis]